MTRLGVCFGNDVRLQWRAGLYAVYALLIAVYVGALSALDPALLRPGLTLLIFADPAALGFFFVGGLMLFERGDGVLDALFAGPLRAWEYIVAKALSLGLLALLSSVVLVLGLGVLPPSPGRLLQLTLGVSLTAVMITFFAVAMGSRLSTVNRYFFVGALCALPIVAPLLGLVGLVDPSLVAWSPAAPGLALIEAGLGGAELTPLASARAVALLVAWGALFFGWALRWFRRYVIGGRR